MSAYIRDAALALLVSVIYSANAGLATAQDYGQAHVIGSNIPIKINKSVGAAANISVDAFRRGAHDVPDILQKMGVKCDIKQAAYIATTSNQLDIYETACKSDLGYILLLARSKPPIALDCISAPELGKISCMLPLNNHPADGLRGFLQAAKVKCTAWRARFIGEDKAVKVRRYEAACSEGGGYIVDIPLASGDGPAPMAADCLQSPSECTFTPHVESVAMLAHEVGAKLGTNCKVGDARYIGYVTANQSDMYELSCQKGQDGLLIELDRSETLRSAVPCKGVKLVGASCQLKATDTVDPLITHAQLSGASPPLTMTSPDWIRRPSGDDFSSLYPRDALAHRLGGQATLTCRTTLTGAVEGCFVTDESPIGYGFGTAALKMAGKFHMKPATEDGRVVAGEHVMIPIKFAIK